MSPRNLFIFAVDYVKSLGGKGRGVIIVRNTKVEDITNMFDQFLLEPDVAKVVQYKKESSPDHPDMIIYRVDGGEEHIVFGKSEQGWKDDYGLTHDDLVISVS
jgi:hypothetical protein